MTHSTDVDILQASTDASQGTAFLYVSCTLTGICTGLQYVYILYYVSCALSKE